MADHCKDIVHFFIGHFNEIRRGGGRLALHKLRILFRIVSEKILYIIFYPISLLVIFIQDLARPWVNIRIGEIRTDRLGHLALEPEIYLSGREINAKSEHTRDIFFFGDETSNRQLKIMWGRVLPIRPLSKFLYILNSRLPEGKRHIIQMDQFSFDTYPLQFPQPHLKFTEEEEMFGQKQLLEMGVPKNAQFICFHARDPSYLNTRSKEIGGYAYGRNWGYLEYRNVDINNYMPALEELANRGYYLIRMGAIVASPLPTTNPRIIDYANRFRSEFMDIYLSAKCTFFIGGTTGMVCVPQIFRRPVAFVNVIPIGQAQVCREDYLFIPKKLFIKTKGRLMTLREMFETGAAWFDHSEQYEELGIELTENTPDEIKALVLEMDERIKGTWRGNDEDDELQKKFWSVFNPPEAPHYRPCHNDIRAYVGADFLRRHRELLQ